MTDLLFEGGPLDGQRLNVADHVSTYLDPPLADSAPASYRNVTYRREGDVFRVESR
jgi:hypothetical protein